MKKGWKITLITASVVIGTALLTLSCMILPHKGLAGTIADNMRISTQTYSKETYTGTTYKDIQYSDISESDTLDLYIPKDIDNPKLMVLIHGGGFAYNDSTSRQSRFMYEYFRNDYAVASINYRLSGEAKFPAAVEDVKAALRYLAFNARAYGYDAEDLILWGESAGGYLATMAAFSPYDEYSTVPFTGEREISSIIPQYDVGTLVDFYGILDFSVVPEQYKELDIPNWLTTLVGNNLEKESAKSIAVQFFGEKISEMTIDKLSEINPLSRIDQNRTYDINAYITHGASDITVPYLQSKTLYDTIKPQTTGNVVYNLQSHYKHADDRFYSKDSLKALKEFLQQ